ncbi:MAG: hypothetical protein MUE85_08915 [Microscillaceae bacterium]|jgi:hypothetical protein|nr:hypothetical protein [Microscillaceae bacterium]
MLKAIKDIAFLRNFLQDEVYLVNERKRYPVVIFYEEATQEYLKPQDEVFLEKILQAVNVPLLKTRLINLKFPEPEDTFQKLIEIPSEKIISFGANLQHLNLNTSEQYQLKYVGDLTCLYADSLAEISESKEKKKQLWDALKAMFFANN